MDVEEVAERAARELVQRLPDLASVAADSLVGLLRDRLSASRSGARALESLRIAPEGLSERRLVVDLLADDLARDDRFATRVASELGGPVSTQASTARMAPGSRVKGDVAGGNIDKSKKYHIGSIRFGGGGLSALVIVGALVSGSGGAVVYNTVIEPYARTVVDQSTAPTRTGSTISNNFFNQGQDIDRWGRLGGDGIGDIVYRERSVESLTTGQLATLPSNENPTLARCRQSLESPVPRVENLDRGSIICVQTSAGATVALTYTNVEAVNAAGAFTFQIDYLFWEADA